MIAKALASDADVVMIDLEDAVAPMPKSAARADVARALREGDWRGRPRTFRINALDTPWFVHDLVEVIDGANGLADLMSCRRWAARGRVYGGHDPGITRSRRRRPTRDRTGDPDRERGRTRAV
jgi:hypothetical protein